MIPVAYAFNEIKEKYHNYIVRFSVNTKLSDIYHSHDFYEFILIAKGSCRQLINETVYPLDEDTLVLMRPGDRHCCVRQTTSTQVLFVSVGKDEFESFSNAYDPTLKDELCRTERPVIFSQPGIYSDLIMACGNPFKVCSEHEYKFLLSYLIKLYIELSIGKKSDIPQHLNRCLKEFRQPENLKDGIPALVALSGYSRSHLSRLMKKYFHVTLHEYVVRVRLEAAYNELLLSRESVEAIAEKVGYDSVSHFNKIFKSTFEITPAALRKKQGIWTV